LPSQNPILLYSGRVSIYRCSNTIARVGDITDLEQERKGLLNARDLGFTPTVINIENSIFSTFLHDSAIFTESCLGEIADEKTRQELLSKWLNNRSFQPQETIDGTVLQLLKQITPHVKLDVRALLKILRSENEGTRTIHRKTIERILQSKMSVVWHRGLVHGALIERRIRKNGFCCWRHSKMDGFRGQDVAPYVNIERLDSYSIDIALHVLKWNWKFHPTKVPLILEKMNLLSQEKKDEVFLQVSAHPNLSKGELETILGCDVGKNISIYLARRAIWRSRRVMIAGRGIEIQTSIPLEPKKDPHFLQKMHRSETDLFSRFHDGIQLDDVGRYSLTPEKEALYIASKVTCSIVVDAFGGCGGNVIAFAQQKNIKQVFCCEINAKRLSMAKQNVHIYGLNSKITFVNGDCTLQKWSVDTMVFIDPPWDAGMKQMQNWLTWAKENFSSGIAKLPTKFPLSDHDVFEVLLSPEGYPRYLLHIW
jgi:hypothetical protein